MILLEGRRQVLAARALALVAVGPDDAEGRAAAQAAADDRVDDRVGHAVIALPGAGITVGGGVGADGVVGDVRIVGVDADDAVVGLDVARIVVEEALVQAADLLQAVGHDADVGGHALAQAGAGRAAAADRAGHVRRVAGLGRGVADAQRDAPAEVLVRGAHLAAVIHQHAHARAVQTVGRALQLIGLHPGAVAVVQFLEARQRRLDPQQRVFAGQRLDGRRRQLEHQRVGALQRPHHARAVANRQRNRLGVQIHVFVKHRVNRDDHVVVNRVQLVHRRIVLRVRLLGGRHDRPAGNLVGHQNRAEFPAQFDRQGGLERARRNRGGVETGRVDAREVGVVAQIAEQLHPRDIQRRLLRRRQRRIELHHHPPPAGRRRTQRPSRIRRRSAGRRHDAAAPFDYIARGGRRIRHGGIGGICRGRGETDEQECAEKRRPDR
ncbi:hypothetical protein RAS1_30700 [Phycisphaerae bacterium RAS1]|nr:hypothetical protein RAS1_30700 [Phycisphaerae bacterium RAS1]